MQGKAEQRRQGFVEKMKFWACSGREKE